MKYNLRQTNNSFRENNSRDLGLLSKYDKLVLIVFAVTLLSCVGATVFMILVFNVNIVNSMMIVTSPFFILGLMWYNHEKKWHVLIFIIGLSVLIYHFTHGWIDEFTVGTQYSSKGDFLLLFAIDFILIGSFGVASVVSAVQRFLFFRIVSMIRSINLKEDMSMMEKIIAFMFNIPSDLDTRSLDMNTNLCRASIPWREIRETMGMSLMIATFIWIYFSMSPTFSAISSFSNIPMYVFAIILYVPVLVMPWSIFYALDVRVKTSFRSFKLYSGIKGTIERIMLPVFAALIYVLIAFRNNDPMTVLTFIGTSIMMIVLVTVFTSTIYYTYFENKLVDDIVPKWKTFNPEELLITVNDQQPKREYPGTPQRDMTDFGDFTFKE